MLAVKKSPRLTVLACNPAVAPASTTAELRGFVPFDNSRAVDAKTGSTPPNRPFVPVLVTSSVATNKLESAATRVFATATELLIVEPPEDVRPLVVGNINAPVVV